MLSRKNRNIVKNNEISSELKFPILKDDIFFKNDTLKQKGDNYPKAIAFQGITARGIVKNRGILMHLSNLPAERSFCGQFGDAQTKKFVDWLVASKQNIWVMNPLNALDDNLCPYSSIGRFSRNKFNVNLNKLVDNEYGALLKEEELPEDIQVPNFTLEMLEKQKNPRFKKAYERFKLLDEASPLKKEYNKFVEKNDELWLESYANYDAISKIYDKNWIKWDVRLQVAPSQVKKMSTTLTTRVARVLEKIGAPIKKEDYNDLIGLYKFEQFIYDKQFKEFVDYLKTRNIRLVLDLPIGVSAIGADTWAKKEIFLLNNDYTPTKVTGCPPKNADARTQVWGHALYNYDSPEFWKYQEESIRQLLETSDLRLDHFAGYVNRAEIPSSYTKPDGTVLYGEDIFKPIEKGGMGPNFFKQDWIVDISNKHNKLEGKNNETVFDLLLRVAKELGKKPEEAYILESLGILTKTKAYADFEEKYGENFINQRIPVAMLFPKENAKPSVLTDLKESMKNQNIAILTGNHDLPSLNENIEKLLDEKATVYADETKNFFKEFCKTELQLSKDEMNDPQAIWKNFMKWFYIQDVNQVQTTLQDALALFWRPNIPSYWEGMLDKFLMKPTAQALTSFWSRVFPKDFLERDNISGINPGYKQAADMFVEIMSELYPDE